MSLPEPYYDRDGITIYHADCREILPMLKPASVDLMLTDPPFFMPATHYQSRVRWQRSWADTSILGTFWSVILDHSIPLIRRSGHLITFSDGNSYPVFYPEMYRRFDALASLVWDKGHVGLGRVWRHQHELMIAGRWESSEFFEDGRLRSSVIQAKATSSTERNHPVEKPTSLLRELIIPTTPESGMVLDPFMGGGSTIEAAKTLGRLAIGIEMEERYCEIAVKRLQQSVLPLEVSS